MKSLVRLAILLLLIVFFYDYARTHWREFSVITRVEAVYLVPILLLQSVVLLVNALLFRVQCTCIDLRMSTAEAISTTVVTSLGNMFLPFRGGLGLRVAYFRVVHGADLLHLFAVTTGNYIVVFGINALFCLPLLLAFLPLDSWMNAALAVIPAVILAGCLLVIFTPVERLVRVPWHRINRILNRAAEGWATFRACTQALKRGAGFAAVNGITTGVILYAELLALHAVGPGFDAAWLLKSLAIALMGSFSLFISITPAALGIRESLTIVAASALGLSPPVALAACVVDRVTSLAVSAALGAPAYLHLTSRKRAVQLAREAALIDRAPGNPR